MLMIETNTNESWSIYSISDQKVFFKHCASRKTLRNNIYSWTFGFTNNQLEQIKPGVSLALICASKEMKDKNTGICFIEKEISNKIFSENSKTITIHLQPGCSYKISSKAIKGKISIPQNAIDKFALT
ncbi:hypothetical protein [Pelagibaculum spongiae]|uniref:hypothetical protein n=1 Tax=Pelagibaculum spongiae TaxID=2080658 RepID=UPI001057AADD|nr:hypothetical protein [Pelagibaculum spongiae]